MPNHSVRDRTYPLLQSGLSVSQVCKETGVAKGTALRHARELRIIEQDRLTPRYDWGEVQKAYDAGMAPTRCMERFGFGDSAWTRAIQTGKVKPDPARQRKRGCKVDEDLSGTRYGKLVVMRQVESTADHHRQWLCRCDCGNEKVWTTSALNYGGDQSCGCASRRRGKENPKWVGHGDISGGYWSNLRRGAEQRSLAFQLTIEEAWALFQSQGGRCGISGVSLSFSCGRGEQTASLDRVDSSRGYVLDNVQWVHKDVNLMKLDHPIADFLRWIDTIYQHQHHSERDTQ